MQPNIRSMYHLQRLSFFASNVKNTIICNEQGTASFILSQNALYIKYNLYISVCDLLPAQSPLWCDTVDLYPVNVYHTVVVVASSYEGGALCSSGGGPCI